MSRRTVRDILPRSSFEPGSSSDLLGRDPTCDKKTCQVLFLSPDRALIFLVVTLLATKRPDRPVELLFGMIARLSC